MTSEIGCKFVITVSDKFCAMQYTRVFFSKTNEICDVFAIYVTKFSCTLRDYRCFLKRHKICDEFAIAPTALNLFFLERGNIFMKLL